MTRLLRTRVSVLVAVVALIAAGSSCEARDRSAQRSDHQTECPEYPVFDRNLDADASGRDAYPDEPAFSTPEEAVRSVAGGRIKVVAVRMSGRVSEVDVRLADDTGTFFVERRHVGWQVKGGDGCATWPAAEELVGPLDAPDCPMPSVDPSATEQLVMCSVRPQPYGPS